MEDASETSSETSSESEKEVPRQDGHVTGLLNTLKAMVNNPQHSDVVFACMDGERVHACRMLITARSSFFNSMLNMGWAESKQAEISLPEISSRALLSIFGFLYTGRMFDDEEPSWTYAFEVLGAAQFLSLQEAVEFIWDYLEDMTWKIADLPEENDLITTAHMLSVAMKFRNLWDENLKHHSVPQQLCRILSRRTLEPLHLICLSLEALLYFLPGPNAAEKETGAESFSFQEYVKLRNVVLWCICQVAPEKAVEVSISYLPRPYFALRLLEEPVRMKRHRPPRNASDYVKSILLRSGPEHGLGHSDSLLSKIDLQRVNPGLLRNVVEPLGVFPSSQVMDAYRRHAKFKRPQEEVNVPEPDKLWEHGPAVRTTDDAFVIEKIDNMYLEWRDDFAKCMVPLCRSYGIYEWDVSVESPDSDEEEGAFPIIGVVHGKGVKKRGSVYDAFPHPEFQHDYISWGRMWAFMQSSDGQCYVNRSLGEPGGIWQEYGKAAGSHHISVVRVHLNMSERTCWFSYQGQEFEGHQLFESGLSARVIAFKKMPRGVYFPAVTFGETSKIRIKLVRGFDIA